MPKLTRFLFAFGLLLLAGCTDASLQSRLPLDAPILTPRWVESASGERLALHQWQAEGPEAAVILALHGFGDAGALTYSGPAAYWAARGITTYAIDQRGFGANPSRRQWPGAATLIGDAVALSRTLRTRHPGAPLIVVGHSMGGGVALAAAAEGLAADALVLAGPAIAGGEALSPVVRGGAWAIATALPDRRWTGRGIVSIRPTDNEAAIDEVRRDPRHFADPSGRELFGLVVLMDRAAEAAPRVTIPTLTLMGERDQVLLPARVRAIHERIPGRVGFIAYPEGWHWLFRDLQAERVWHDVADFALSARRA